MKSLVLSGSLFVLVATATRAGAQVPSWCTALDGERVDGHGTVQSVVADDDPRNALKDLTAKLCHPDGEAADHRQELEGARKKWSTRLDLSEADWADVAAYATLGQGARMSGEVQLADTSDTGLKRAWSTFDAIDQYVWLTNPIAESGALVLDYNYLADAFGPRLTEVGRFAYVRKCIRTADKPVQWAMCQGDIERLDLGKLAAELRANKVYGGHEKTRIRIAVAEYKSEIAAHDAKVKRLIASDPAYADLFATGKAQWNEWESRYATDAALLELAMQMDDARVARSRRAFAGCEDRTRAAWKAAVSAIPAKKFEGMRDERDEGRLFSDQALGPIIADPRAYLAAIALATCMSIGQDPEAPRDVLVRLLGTVLEYWPGFRGPRTATESVVLGMGVVLDDRNAKLDYPLRSRPFGGRNLGVRGGAHGVVAALKPDGKSTTIEFWKQMVKQVQCAETKETNKVTQIRSDGTLQYQMICLRHETVTVNVADPPQIVSPRYLDGVKPGVYLTTVEDVVAGVWSKPGATVPIAVFGAPVK